MPRARSYYYLLDGLTAEKGGVIRRALETLPGIEAINVSPAHGVVEVIAASDPIEQVKMACEIARIAFRMQLKRRHLS